MAALLPEEWTVRLVDRNIEELLDGDMDLADLIMIGGMLPQQADTKRVIALAHAHDKTVVLGGPDVTFSPSVFEEVEFRLLGEVEDIMDDFLTAWRRGDRRGIFQAPAFPDLQKSPVPRFDLLKLQHYMHVGVQYSRRLHKEGRLHPDSGRVGNDDAADQCTSGLNFDTLRPRLEILEDYRAVLHSIYHPVSFFGRVRRNARALRPVRERFPNQFPLMLRDIRSFLRISWRLGVRDREVRVPYWKAMADCIRHNPQTLRTVVSFAALYLHMRPFSGFMADRLQGQIEELSLPEQSLLVPLARGMEA